MDFVVKAYVLLEKFPPKEQYALTEQLRRSLVSIPSNIAEGCARFSDKETIHFLDMANGSLAELETQVLISQELGYLSNNSVVSKINDISRMLTGLKKHLKNKVVFDD